MKPATTKTRALRSKLQALAERGINGEATSQKKPEFNKTEKQERKLNQ